MEVQLASATLADLAADTREESPHRPRRRRARIPDDYVSQLQVAFGYPESTARDRRALYPNRVSWI